MIQVFWSAVVVPVAPFWNETHDGSGCVSIEAHGSWLLGRKAQEIHKCSLLSEIWNRQGAQPYGCHPILGPFLGFPALCLHCPLVLVCCLLPPLQPWAYSSQFFEVPGLVIPTSLPGLVLMLALSLQIVVFCFVLFLPFSMACSFFLIAGHDVLSKRNCSE